MSISLESKSMRSETVRQRLARLSEEIFDVRVVKVAVGKDKKPIDKPDEIIFHIDI